MGLGDKFKTMAKQAQDAVAEHKDKLQETVETVGVAVNDKTQGKYASKISKIGEKANQTIEKVGSGAQSEATAESASVQDSDAASSVEDSPAAAPSVADSPAPNLSDSPAPSFGDSPAPSFADAPVTDSPSAADATPSAAPPSSDGFPSFDD
jgi:hypothetical protein